MRSFTHTHLARALAVGPSVLLLDEPLSALDPGFRDEIQQVLKNLHQEAGTTFMMVTHDFSEALFLGEHAAILNNGRIEQDGPVNEIFRFPKTVFAARFVGIKNLFPAIIRDREADINGMSLLMAARARNGRHHVAIRSEDIHLLPAGKRLNGPNQFEGYICNFIDRGPYGEATVKLDRHAISLALKKTEWMECAGDGQRKIRFHIPPASIHVIV